jgi:hypothetical protein
MAISSQGADKFRLKHAEELLRNSPCVTPHASTCSSSGPAMKTYLITRSYLVTLWAVETEIAIT